ncbi:hypothetical protein ykris0001_31470 [Yersinia kristensenii ATCC 33638]|nr:hypothetical protein ykris0001_31470 [Yersinia kristensenii ATCC 33638]
MRPVDDIFFVDDIFVVDDIFYYLNLSLKNGHPKAAVAVTKYILGLV